MSGKAYRRQLVELLMDAGRLVEKMEGTGRYAIMFNCTRNTD